MKKRLLGGILALVMAASLIGCGGSKSGGGSELPPIGIPSVDDPGVVFPGGDGFGGDIDPDPMLPTPSNNDMSCVIYVVNPNKIHVQVQGPQCEAIMNNKGSLIVDFEDGAVQLNLSSDYASLGWRASEDNWESINKGSYDTSIYSFQTIYGVDLEADGIANRLKDSMAYTIFVNQYEGTINGQYGQGKLRLEQIDEAALTTVVMEEVKSYVPANSSHDIWAGEYIFSNYDYDAGVYHYGFVDIIAGDKGALTVSYEYEGAVQVFLMEEMNYDEVTYDYGSFTEAKIEVPGNSNRGSVSYTRNASGMAEYYFNYNDSSNSRYVSGSLTPLDAGSKIMPENYDDSDTYGYATTAMQDNTGYFSATTDDYLLTVRKGSFWGYIGDEYQELPCVEYNLYSFDANNMCIDWRIRIDFESANDAQKVYKEYSKYEYYKGVYVEDNHFYYTSSASPRKKSEMVYFDNYNCYEGAHYAYYYYHEGDYVSYIYMSKPYKPAQNMPKEFIRLFVNIPNGDHRSIDIQNSSMYTSLSVYSNYIGASISFYAEDLDTTLGEVRYEGNTFKMLTYYESWDDIYYVDVTVIEFTAEEAVLTQYRYMVEDFRNVKISMDNYTSFTADKTITHRYDMQRVVTY